MRSEPSSLTTTSRHRRRLIAIFSSLLAILPLMLILGIIRPDNELSESSTASSVITHRKLLHTQESKARKHHKNRGGITESEPNRIWSEKCTISNIVVSQGQTTPLPNGIPVYSVEIMNVCNTGCIISAIHLHCGWFGSARVINPHIFRQTPSLQ